MWRILNVLGHKAAKKVLFKTRNSWLFSSNSLLRHVSSQSTVKEALNSFAFMCNQTATNTTFTDWKLPHDLEFSLQNNDHDFLFRWKRNLVEQNHYHWLKVNIKYSIFALGLTLSAHHDLLILVTLRIFQPPQVYISHLGQTLLTLSSPPANLGPA
jgi:hypothetical protein